MAKDVTLYTSNTCPFCTMATSDQKGVSMEKNISTDPSARNELMAKGYTGVPVTNIDGTDVVGL